MKTNWAEKLLKLAEGGYVQWEAIARECIAQMNADEAESVAVALELDQEMDLAEQL